MLLRIFVVYVLLGAAIGIKFTSVSFKDMESIPKKIWEIVVLVLMAPIWFAQGIVIGIKELIEVLKDSE